MSKLILLSEGDKVSVSVDTFCGKNYNHAVSTSDDFFISALFILRLVSCRTSL